MDKRIVITRSNNRHVVALLGKVREQTRNFDPGFTMFFEWKGRRHQLSVRRPHELQRQTLAIERLRERLIVILDQLGFRVEGFDLTRPTRHK